MDVWLRTYRCTARPEGACGSEERRRTLSWDLGRSRPGKKGADRDVHMARDVPSAKILTLRTLRRLFPARTIFSNESPQYAAVSSKYFMPYTRICNGRQKDSCQHARGSVHRCGEIGLPEARVRSLLCRKCPCDERMVVSGRRYAETRMRMACIPPEELERDRVEAGVVDRGEPACVRVLDGRREPLLEYLVCWLRADHDVLRVVEEDTWGRVLSLSARLCGREGGEGGETYR